MWEIPSMYGFPKMLSFFVRVIYLFKDGRVFDGYQLMENGLIDQMDVKYEELFNGDTSNLTTLP